TRTRLSTLSLHDALPISFSRAFHVPQSRFASAVSLAAPAVSGDSVRRALPPPARTPSSGHDPSSLSPSDVFRVPRPYRRPATRRSEEHTSELQSRENIVC